MNVQDCISGSLRVGFKITPLLMLWDIVSPYIPQPVFFFVPSQLVSSPLEPPPPVLIPPLPPAARNKFAIRPLETVIASQSCRVRAVVSSILKSDW